MNKKILHVISCSTGGAGTVLEDILVGISTGLHVKLLVLGEIGNINKYLLESHNISVEVLGSSKLLNIKTLLRIFLCIKKYKPDIVNTHLFPTIYLVALVSLFFRKIHFVHSEHSSFNNRLSKSWMKPIEKFMYNRFEVLIGVSKSVSEMLGNWIEHRYIVTINNGLGLSVNTLFNDDTLFKGVLSNKFVISMAARFVEGKDFKTLIEVFTLLDDNYHLLLIGEGEYLNECKDYVEKLKLSNKITFLGYRTDVLNIFRQSNLTILSSEAEGLPMVILESFIVNTPGIGSNVPGIRDLLNKKEYLFEYKNVNDLLLTIKYFSINPKKESIDLYIKEINDKFSLSNMVNSYLKLYERLVD